MSKYNTELVEIEEWETNNNFAGDSFILAATYDGKDMTEDEIIEMEEEHPYLLNDFLTDMQAYNMEAWSGGIADNH